MFYEAYILRKCEGHNWDTDLSDSGTFPLYHHGIQKMENPVLDQETLHEADGM